VLNLLPQYGAGLYTEGNVLYPLISAYYCCCYYYYHLVLWLCMQEAKYHIEMYEGTPVVPLYFQPTLRLPCPDCYIELEIIGQVGLTLSRCSLNFTDTSTQTLMLRAVRTAGSNSRIVTLRFRTVVSGAVDSVWQGYSQPDIRVTPPVSFSFTFVILSLAALDQSRDDRRPLPTPDIVSK